MKKIPHDLAIVQQVLATFTPAQRREWFIKIRMSDRGQSFEHMATRHRITRQALSNAVQGGATWSPRIIKALQDDLRVDLAAFLTAKEAAKYRASKSHH